MIEEFIKLKIYENGRWNPNAQRMIKNRDALLDSLLKETSYLPEETSLKERMYFCTLSTRGRPKCKICGINSVNFEERGSPRFTETCSKHCASSLTLKSIGDEGLKQRSKKRNETMSSAGTFKKMYHKAHATKVSKGLAIPYSEHTEFQKYISQCRKITNKNDLSTLKNYHKRGRCGVPGAYQLDHKISIAYGFKNGISPEIIGHIQNLEFIPWKSNSSKSSKCSITLEHLEQLIKTP